MTRKISQIVALLFAGGFILGALVFAQEKMQIRVSSPVFSPMGKIPRQYTCQGRDINPPLEITDIPPAAKSIAVIVDDPDAPFGTWVHWVMYDIPAAPTISIAENNHLGKEGVNDFKNIGYGGPCPPFGRHRYFFKVYALDTVLGLSQGMRKSDLLRAMKGHVLAQGQLVGVYQKE